VDAMMQVKNWTGEHLGQDVAALPFSFVYDGKPSSELLSGWKSEATQKQLDKDRLQRTLTYTDPQTNLEVRCVIVEYADYPTVEWTVYLKNTGSADTPIIENLQALDTTFARGERGEFNLHCHRGDDCTWASFYPYDEVLWPGTTKRFVPLGGRPTNFEYPFYNLEWDDGGALIVLGWGGQWASEFARDYGRNLHIKGGQELTHFKLLPGEEVRTPLVVMQFYTGASVAAQNVWRRWMLEHNVPKPHGKTPPPMLIMCDGLYFDGMLTSEEGEKLFMDAYVREGLKPDYWWVDAGWYKTPENWGTVGTWEPDPVRYPNGLRGVSDYAHKLGMKLIVWFEPERISGGSWLWENHPDWIVGGREGYLFNLGHPEAWNWLVEHFDGLLVSENIDLYRQDYNCDPLVLWRANDAPDRQGITENKCVMGHYAYWDELRRRHPDMLIDTCASGGRRTDLETLRRSVPLLRSDDQWHAISQQNHTFGLSSWVPFYGTGYGGDKYPTYETRSALCPCFGAGIDVRKEGNDKDYEVLRGVYRDWRNMVAYMLADYYPLTAPSLADDVWIAWEFFAPEKGEGVVQAFRRPDNTEPSVTLKLQALDPAANYAVTDLDNDQAVQYCGQELMEQGLTIHSEAAPQAKIFTIKKLA
jgi:alpha-galactosidase